jgi:prepilin-type N-terminal cleavage/methylation domain-containing protein
MELQEWNTERREGGFTLIELLIAIVVVGILTAVAIIGIAGLSDKGTKSACNATYDATKAAIAVHFANSDKYPQQWTDLTAANELELQSGAAPDPGNAKVLKGKGWTITMSGGGDPTAGGTPTQLTAC